MTGPVETVDILGPAHGGTSVARLDGQVVFVRGALPGEKGVPVRLDAAPEGQRFLTAAVGDVSAIGEASVHRVEARCPAAAAGAGCCDLDFVDPEGSLAYKTRVVVEQFRRIGHLDLDSLLGDGGVETRSPEPFAGYRTRARLGVDADGRAGLRERGGTAIIPLQGLPGPCAQWDPALADGLVDDLAGWSLTPGAEVCVAVGDDGVRSVVEVPAQPRQRRRRHRTAPRSRARDHSPAGRRVLGGSGEVVRTVAGVSWRVPAESFWQAHRGAADLYSAWVTGNSPSDGGTAWDLYGGAGVFAAALTQADPGISVDCVDIASPATAAGEAALRGRDVRFVTGDVAGSVRSLRGAAPGSTPPSVVVLDPPRTGAGQKVVDAVADRAPASVLHVGCDPATAARDAAAFVRHGYTPDSVTVVDAFGLTHHVEVLVRYVRRPG
ncbi:TRAM domain-containing protein [Corynebacterium sp. USCH3]|uniref:class I SAM-dependent RNA methyltransferase n=1 Tax=Corynebacterium sp. USCH3 TaxID=3024840 RepID=UPI0030A797D4